MRSPARDDFPLSSRPIVAFAGPFGSGKTEVAINYALTAFGRGRYVCIADLDIVTPYFRVGDVRERLTAVGLQVIAPEGARAAFETPSLSPEIGGALAREELHVVLDVGGDPVGARLLGLYAGHLAERGCDLWMVVNPFRPWSGSPQAVAEQVRAIEASSQLRVTGLVANPHLGPWTEQAHLQAGLQKVREAAVLIGGTGSQPVRSELPLVCLAVERSLASAAAALGAPVLPLDLHLRPPWQGW